MRAAEITELAERSLRARGASWMRREVNVGDARADLAAVIDGRIVLVEVKGAGDSAARLRNQLDSYSRIAHAVELWVSDAVIPRARESWSARYPWLDIVSAERTADVMQRGNDATTRVLDAVGSALPDGPTRLVLSFMHVPELRGHLRALGIPRGKKHDKWSMANAMAERLTCDEAKRLVARTWAARDWSQWKREREERAAAREAKRAARARAWEVRQQKTDALAAATRMSRENSTDPFGGSPAHLVLLSSATLWTWENWAQHISLTWGELATQGLQTIERAREWVEPVRDPARPADVTDAMIERAALVGPREISPGADAWALAHRALMDTREPSDLRLTHRRLHRALASEERVARCRFCNGGAP